ncbi:hypothetical protein ACRALDRAFT_2039011 [Sodiomyces alcalophilus JCM 7366]|uniref:uncharacterized protein n=1 Tax=Sodiomyces alcalophilus JCM 7366 TaxID=591952 RepID=UPI0039B60C1D
MYPGTLSCCLPVDHTPLRVPTTAAVIRGASVNVILKADQPTGRTVSGIVQDILTRGNHPRGIKVRLTDGRVGRVQSLVASAASHGVQQEQQQQEQKQQKQQHLGEAGAETQALGQDHDRWAGRGGRGRGPKLRYRDIREQDEAHEPPAQTLGLDAYIRPAKVKKGRGDNAHLGNWAVSEGEAASAVTPTQSLATTEATVTCPVCGVFEGDAAAVEHHVGSHFDS